MKCSINWFYAANAIPDQRKTSQRVYVFLHWKTTLDSYRLPIQVWYHLLTIHKWEAHKLVIVHAFKPKLTQMWGNESKEIICHKMFDQVTKWQCGNRNLNILFVRTPSRKWNCWFLDLEYSLNVVMATRDIPKPKHLTSQPNELKCKWFQNKNRNKFDDILPWDVYQQIRSNSNRHIVITWTQ